MTTPGRRRAASTALLLEHRRRRKQRERRSFVSRARSLSIVLGMAVSVLFMAGLLAAGAFFLSVTRELPPVEKIAQWMDTENGVFQQPTQIFDRSGEKLLFTLAYPNITRRYLSVDPVQTEHFSPHLVQVFTALEPGFWSGTGLSLPRLASAQPSTMAEQLVDAFLLETEPAGLRRAVRMRLLAGQLTTQVGKTKVLEWFMNSAYFGSMTFGADLAAQVYLGKPANNLNLAESALLASLLSTPALNPLDAPQAARERTQAVLDQLEQTGQFAREEIDAARSIELNFENAVKQPLEMDEFVGYVLDQLEQQLSSRQIERGGLKVISTLDMELQEQLICTVETQLQRVTAGTEQGAASCEAARQLPALRAGSSLAALGGTGASVGGLVMDPHSSEILAWSGPISYGSGEMPGPTQAGSLLAPFTAAAAFARGMSPATLVWDAPDAASENGGLEPDMILNPDGIWHGPQHLRSAILHDYLNPVNRVAELVGVENVWLLAKTLGLDSLQRQSFAEDLWQGVGMTSLLEIGQAYSVFANTGQQTGLPSVSGSRLIPAAVLRVEDLQGNILYTLETRTQALLDPALAYLVHDVLASQKAIEIGLPAGIKTGTADEGRQVWTVGYTTRRLAVIWLGLAPGESFANAEPGQPAPVEITAGIWQAVIQYAAQEEPAQDWVMPPEIVRVTVCSPSGLLLTSACPNRVDELFISGSEPVTSDSLYRTYSINRETGNLATIFTPLELVEEQTFLVPPAAYQEWARSSGIAQPPNDYDSIRAPEPRANVEITSPGPFSYVRGEVEIQGSAGGDDFTQYRLQFGQGMNPHSWIQIGIPSEQAVENGRMGSWDTSGLDGLYVIRLTVLRTQNRLESHVVQVSVDNTAPTAQILYPSNGTVVPITAGKEIVLLAEVSDAVGVDRIEWLMDGKTAGQSSSGINYLLWIPSPGRHVLRVIAYDLAGNKSQPDAVEFTVQ